MKKFIIASLLMVSGIAFAQYNNTGTANTATGNNGSTQGTTTTNETVTQTQDPTTGGKKTHKVKKKTKVQDTSEANSDSTQAD